MWMFLWFMLSKTFLKLSSFFKILFPLATLLGCYILPCLPNHWLGPLLHLTYSFSFSVLFISDIAFFISDWSPFMVSTSFLMLLSMRIIITPNSVSDILPPFHLVLLKNPLVLSFGVCFFVFSFLAAFLYLFPCIRSICKDSDAGLCQILLVATCLELPMTHRLWPPLLGLGVCRKNRMCTNAVFYQLCAWGKFS